MRTTTTRRTMSFAWALVALMAAILCMATHEASAAKYRVLFIGNSLTARNKLPQHFKALCNAGKKNVVVASSTFPAFTLQQHVLNTATLKLLWGSNWTHVVIQEQSATLSFNMPLWEADRTYQPAKQIADAAKRDGRNGKTIIYETMAYIGGNFVGDSYEAMQQRVIDGHERLRRHLGAETAPVGKVWRRARREIDAKKQSKWLLYSDDTHPSPRGTFLAATVIYRQIFGERVDKLKPKLPKGVKRAFTKRAYRWTEDEYANPTTR